VDKDILTESMVLIGIQILNIKPASVMLADGREGNWIWDHGNDVSLMVPGKYLQQISPELISEHRGTLPGAITYRF